jgi:uncharacterized membrane protein HdeD (DUF308 family)
MEAQPRTDTTQRVVGAGRQWEWVLAFGIVTIAAGILALVWPGRTIVAVAVLFGIQLIAAGVFRFAAALATDEASGGTRVLFALLGVLSFIVGLYAVRNVQVTVAALALVLGIFWVVNGAIEVFAALAYRDVPRRGWAVAMGALSVVAGVVVLAYPGISLVTLAVVLGFWLVALGVMELFAAFAMRSVGRATSRLAPAL